MLVRGGWGVLLALKLARSGGVALLQDTVVGQGRMCRVGIARLDVVEFAGRQSMDDRLRAT